MERCGGASGDPAALPAAAAKAPDGFLNSHPDAQKPITYKYIFLAFVYIASRRKPLFMRVFVDPEICRRGRHRRSPKRRLCFTQKHFAIKALLYTPFGNPVTGAAEAPSDIEKIFSATGRIGAFCEDFAKICEKCAARSATRANPDSVQCGRQRLREAFQVGVVFRFRRAHQQRVFVLRIFLAEREPGDDVFFC